MKKSKEAAPDTATDVFHGATLLNEQGEEVPITENMIADACEELLQTDEAATH
jgi:hypothetical protein